jgi:flagellar basal-body rod protein FlgF
VTVPGAGKPSRIMALAETSGVDLGPGAIVTTGRDLDVAVHGEALIAVQSADGREAYTRRGDLQLTPNGALLTGAGFPVLGNGGPIAIPQADKIEIGSDGTISIRPVGQVASTMATVDRIRLVSAQPGELRKGEDGLLYTVNETALPLDANAQVLSGALETGNVNAVAGLVEMIALSRTFETQIRLMRENAENDRSSAETMRIG